MKTLFKFLSAVFSAPPIAINATPLTPLTTSRGTLSLAADAAITFINAMVKSGSDDRHFAATSAQADIPMGVLMNDLVGSDEAGVIQKVVAIFGLYPEALIIPSDGAGALAPGDRIVASAAAAGKVKKMPSTSGQTYIVIGRALQTVAATAGDPVLVQHCTPYAVTNP